MTSAIITNQDSAPVGFGGIQEAFVKDWVVYVHAARKAVDENNCCQKKGVDDRRAEVRSVQSWAAFEKEQSAASRLPSCGSLR